MTTMNPALDLRNLDVDLPARPLTLVELLALLNRADSTIGDIAALVEADMALASAVVRTVNSAMFGLLRRVETVGEAVRYLGTREVAAITFEIALRAAFVPTPAMEAIWTRSSQAGLLMGRSAMALGLDPLQAHTAGLFARSGQAVLLVKLKTPYAELLQAHGHDRLQLAEAEQQQYGVTHAAYGSALCAAWGLAGDVVRYVRDHAHPAELAAAPGSPARRLLTLGLIVDDLLSGRTLPEAVATHTPGSGCTGDTLEGALARPWERLLTALAPA
ncbi:HD-like signal output (HDOD) protein [Sphaerotilus hippei]|uniref:HD-like signal output (HDOD) protein n=2 Tax=Sphaerotilus hippei TaxID=744406 RepID=A0A318GZ27_9BURK|nr:HD-like signal output (HDOD) protein [Sphaerotilus hippei]